MQDFVFHNPTKILFGGKSAACAGQEAALFGRKALLVFGRQSCRKHGTHQLVCSSLLDAGVQIFEHGGIVPNPVLSNVKEGIRLAQDARVEVIVAAGGGSVIDSAKAIAAGAIVRHDVWQFFKGKKSIKASLPLIAIPTLAGSGSETNSGMVLTNEATRQKIGIGNRHLFPRTALLDPALTFTASPTATAHGTVDAISHLLEFYLFREEIFSPLQDAYSEGLIKTLMESCEAVQANPLDYQGRANLMWASSLALNGLSSSGLGRVGFPFHMIEHSLSALYGVPHGAGLAALLPGAMRYHAEKSPARIARYAEKILGFSGENPRELARNGIEHLSGWLKKIGAPRSLSDLGIPAGDIHAIAENTREQARLWRLTHYSPEVVREILSACQ